MSGTTAAGSLLCAPVTIYVTVLKRRNNICWFNPYTLQNHSRQENQRTCLCALSSATPFQTTKRTKSFVEPFWLPLVGIAVVAILLVTSASTIVPAGHAFLIDRLGRHQAVLAPGLHFIIPGVDRIRAKLDTREQVFSKVGEPVVTRDDFVVFADAGVFYQIKEPRVTIYDVADYRQSMDRLIVSTLRTVIGSMDLEEALISSPVIAEELRRVLSWTTGTWGIVVTRAEITALAKPDPV